MTEITIDISWQNLTIAQEIATAYNLRADSCGHDHIETAMGISALDGTVKVCDFILACQTGIEAMAPLWADHTVAIEGLTAQQQNYADAAALFTACGLSETDGWRRIPEAGGIPADWSVYADAAFSYGKFQSKDMAGPWLFKDLETALSYMKRQAVDQIETMRMVASKSGNNIGTLVPSYVATAPGYYQPCEMFVSRMNTTWMVGRSVYINAKKTGLSSHAKTIYAVILPHHSTGTLFQDFGKGFTEDVTNIAGQADNSVAAEVIIQAFPRLTLWSQLISYTSPYLVYEIYATEVRFVIDYLFED